MYKLYRHLRFLTTTFVDKELTLFAASLSFYTIFTFIPLLLMVMTVVVSLNSFLNVEGIIKKIIFENLLPVNSQVIMNHIDNFLNNSSQMGLLSFGMLFITSLLFFKNYEFIVNKIFHTNQRSFFKSVGVYLLMTTIIPLSLGVAFFITSYIDILLASSVLPEEMRILPFVPYIIIWVLFFILYKISPNVKVSFYSALVSSFVISIVFSLAKNSFVSYVFYNKAYTTIYGSFSILLFLFLWIYISWVIFIYGFKLCYLINKKEPRFYTHKGHLDLG